MAKWDTEYNVETVFDLLDDWRNLPSYQLERRADIFFAYYLKEIMKEFCSEEIDYCQIIPEFPVKKEKEDDYRSNKVDYAVFCEKYLYLIELKTDMATLKASLNGDQSKYLKRAKKTAFSRLIGDIPKIGQKSSQKKKYKCLIERLNKLTMPLYGFELTGEPWAEMIKQFEDKKKKSEIPEKEKKIIYICPKEPTEKEKCENKHIDCFIHFGKIAELLEKDNERFSKSLNEWIKAE